MIGALDTIAALRDENEGLRNEQATLIAEKASLIADRARMEKAIELLCEVYEAARDVSMAAVQDDDGEWSIKGDPEMMLGRLYLATEEVRKVTKGASPDGK